MRVRLVLAGGNGPYRLSLVQGTQAFTWSVRIALAALAANDTVRVREHI